MDLALGLLLATIAIIFIIRSLKIVPQQNAWVVERLGKYDRTLTPGLSFLVPFVVCVYLNTWMGGEGRDRSICTSKYP